MAQWMLALVLVLFLTGCVHEADAENSVAAAVEAPNPERAALYNTRLGLAYLKQGDFPRAKRKLVHALKLAPDYPQANAAMGWYLEHTGEPAGADVYYRKAVRNARESGAQCNNYGAFLCRQGKYNEAQRWFAVAVRDAAYSNTAGVYENSGLCARAAGDRTLATQAFEKALAQDAGRSQSLEALAAMALQDGNALKARKLLREHMELTHNDAHLRALAVKAEAMAGKAEFSAQDGAQTPGKNYRSKA
ncbi:fimbrial biogenesis and twitching motility protein PilF [Legionella geestiana]|uniref:Fimbrial biogenesis and twitching motility protein PilF n=1 Tax=Legionella geestiana TaxID=45065 RepID=A0A0W0U997_9GAMM|nr:type IV pilus biogenesis/stability protein PilW [Legionella geestiana]KTD04204.1 fimbrial biogenesis and twitching motility protein PilF [Legionella geestiana]STX53691.1 type IV pilus assembly protein PilF [Legionella geestiana]